MESSLLVAPKPSFFSIGRRSLVAAAGHGKDSSLDTRAQLDPVIPSKVSLVAAGVSVMSLLQPSTAAAATALEPAPPPPALLELYRAVALLGDLDPATAKTVVGVAGPALSAFGFLFILRIVMSWYPRLPVTKFPYVVAYAPTEPFLAVTRKVIPPLGGVDVTPVVWFGLVSFLNEILVGPQGLLILLSQQV